MEKTFINDSNDEFLSQDCVNDYNNFLEFLGISDLDVIKMTETNVCFDSGQHKKHLEILDSEIHGKGLFASGDIEIGQEWLAALGNYKYPCGRIINHSPSPNCEFIFDGNRVTCVAIKKINKGCELLVNYRSHVSPNSIKTYKQSIKAIEFDSKVPSVKDWELSSPIDKIEYELSTLPVAEIPLTHIFTEGLYIRQAYAPAGSMFTTVHHNTEHPFILISGTTEVISNEEASSITGPFMGITKKGTRRLA